MLGLTEGDYLYIAEPPLYRIQIGRRAPQYVYTEDEKDQLMPALEGQRGLQLQRYKGLGEMSPDQLWETTMDPDTRQMLLVKVEDMIEVDNAVQTLIGETVGPRKAFIQAHARNVRNLDIYNKAESPDSPRPNRPGIISAQPETSAKEQNSMKEPLDARDIRKGLRKDLRNLDLTGLNLDRAKLSGTSLKGANLSKTSLRKVQLICSNLTNANLNKANISCGKLAHATLTNTKLTRTNLYKADLTHAHCRDADLTAAKLRKANLQNADLTNSNLTGADLTGADLTGATLQDITTPNGTKVNTIAEILHEGLTTNSPGKPPNLTNPLEHQQVPPDNLELARKWAKQAIRDLDNQATDPTGPIDYASIADTVLNDPRITEKLNLGQQGTAICQATEIARSIINRIKNSAASDPPQPETASTQEPPEEQPNPCNPNQEGPPHPKIPAQEPASPQPE